MAHSRVTHAVVIVLGRSVVYFGFFTVLFKPFELSRAVCSRCTR
jgi:hypothetical protein